MSLGTQAEVIHTHMYPVRYRCERGTVKKAERKRRVHVTRGAEQAPRTPGTSRDTSKRSVRLPSSGTAREGGLSAKRQECWASGRRQERGRPDVSRRTPEKEAPSRAAVSRSHSGPTPRHVTHTRPCAEGCAEAAQCSWQEYTFKLRY